MKKMFFLAGFLLACCQMMAQSWTKPDAPEAMALTTGAECYLYNVGADGFYCGAYDWETRASVKPTHGYKVYIDRYEPEGTAWDGQSYYITSYIENGAPAGQTLCMFVAAFNGVWVDRAKDSEEDKAFTFIDNGDNTFRIGLSAQNAQFTPTLGDYYLGTIPSNGDTRLYFTNTDEQPDAKINWRFVSPANYTKYLAAVEQWKAALPLGAAIADAEERFPTVDISAIKSIYANKARTAEQLKAAHTQLTTLLLAYASPSKPVSVTTSIVNPSYDNNDNNGWIGTTPGFQEYGNAEFYDKNYDASQTISGLKAGVYATRVTAFYRAGGATEDAEEMTNLAEGREAHQNARLYTSSSFIKNADAPIVLASTGATPEALGTGSVENSYGFIPNDMRTAAAYFEAGRYPYTEVINYTADGKLTIGMRKEAKIAYDWTLFDNWELYYLGNSDEALQYLKEQYLTAHPDYVQKVTDGNITYYGHKAFDAYKQAADALTKATTAEAIVAAIPVYDTQVEAFEKSLKAYEELAAAYDEGVQFIEERQNELMGDGMDAFIEYMNEYVGPSEGYTHPNGTILYILDNGSLETSQIADELKYIQQLKEQALTAGMVDGMDCTDLIKNPHFATADGWVKEGLPEYPVGPENYKMGQAYSILFGVSQEITGLQNGLYELSLKDFFRSANYGSAEYTSNHRAYVFMNNTKKLMNAIKDGATEEQADGHNYLLAGVGYVPDNVDDAAASFQAGNYEQTLYGLVTDGKMKIGLRNDLRYEGCWAMWSDLRLTFRAKNPKVLTEVIDNALPEARELLEKHFGNEEKNALTTAITVAADAIGDDCYDAMVALQNAMDATDECLTAYSLLQVTIDNLSETIDAYPNASNISEAKAALSDTQSAFDQAQFNTEQALAKSEELNKLIVSIKLGDAGGESEQDFTNLIVNNNFDPAKGDKGAGRIDGWVTTAMNGYKEYTVSYNRAGFELYQDLSGLPKGKYKVTVNTYYRAGYWYDEEEHLRNGEETHLTTLYAETSADKATTPVINLTEGATTETYHEKFYTLSSGLFAPDGTSPTAAWFAAGAYLNELEFSVPEDGKVRIGLSKTEVYPNDYEVVGEWHLYYYGDPDEQQREDYTNLIVNNNFDPAKGDKGAGRIDGWVTTAMNGYKEYTVSYNRAGFELYQDLTGLPEGNYEVTVNTYYRAGYWYDEEEHMRNGEETHLTTLYAETSKDKATTPVLNLTEGATTETYHEKFYTLSSGLFAPDGTSPTAAWFAAGAYLNTLQFTVPADGKVRIGLSKTEVYPNDYEVVGEWHLYYLGKSDNVDDAVRGLSASTDFSGKTAVFNLAGQQTRGLKHGINIVRQADGSVRKVLVK